jgi:hypothetical protein
LGWALFSAILTSMKKEARLTFLSKMHSNHLVVLSIKSQAGRTWERGGGTSLTIPAFMHVAGGLLLVILLYSGQEYMAINASLGWPQSLVLAAGAKPQLSLGRGVAPTSQRQ